MLSISCGDIMETDGRYLAMFLDNFSPYNVSIHYQLKKICKQKQ